jgi:hypothetical protein
MTDNQMMIALIAELNKQLTDYGITNFEVCRSQQPTTQHVGADKDDYIKTRVFLYSITNPSIGKSWAYKGDISNFEREDTQHKSKSIQISVVHYFDYEDINALTPEDMANLVHDLIDSIDSIKSLREDGVYLESAGGVRPVFMLNDKDNTESLPNFDIVVNYQSSITKASGYVDIAEGDLESA